jgi:hypothetical protein
MKIEYINRYDDKYEFTQEDEQTIKWEGQFKWCRYATDQDGKTTMIDPSGGPYITIGCDMKYIAPEFNDFVVSALEMHNGYALIKVAKKPIQSNETEPF